MHPSIRSLIFAGTALALIAPELHAQTAASHRELDLAVTYTAERSNLVPEQTFWRQGGSFELSAEALHGFGLAMNVAGGKAKNVAGSGIDLNTLATTFGPRYTWHHHTLAVFGQGLLGEEHVWNTLIPQAGGAVSTYDTMALQVGGGIDLRIRPHLALRPVQADWIRTQFPNSTTNVQNNLRLSAGMVLRLPM